LFCSPTVRTLEQFLKFVQVLEFEMRRSTWALALSFATALSVSPVMADEADYVNPDPLEGFNRAMYTFNDTLDGVLLKPLATAYRALPDPIEKGVGNFFSNLGDPLNALNNLLQGKLDVAVNDLMRFVINTTIGIGGIFDVASEAQMAKSDEDFGQTLAVWGVDSGPYLVLPFFGPSTIRDAAGLGVDKLVFAEQEVGNTQIFDLVQEVDSSDDRLLLRATDVVDTRAQLFDTEKVLDSAALDEYTFVRDSWLQRRENQVYDGNPPLPPPPDFLRISD
jgi:phospholipid-binding lipoprotein MlaA